jgi:hypothetical protein
MTAVPGFGLIDCVATTGDLEVLLLTGFIGRAAFGATVTDAAPEPNFGGTEETTLVARGNSEASL